jgi:hypothetical protein
LGTLMVRSYIMEDSKALFSSDMMDWGVLRG